MLVIGTAENNENAYLFYTTFLLTDWNDNIYLILLEKVSRRVCEITKTIDHISHILERPQEILTA